MAAGDDRSAFHLARAARERLGSEDVPATTRGDLLASDPVAIRRLTTRLNETRPPGAPPILPGQLAALTLLHELGHLVIAALETSRPSRSISGALRALRRQVGSRPTTQLLDAFGAAFPAPPGWPPESPETRLAELLLTRVANENPAAEPLRELFDDRPMTRLAAWPAALGVLETSLGPSRRAPAGDPLGQGLLGILRAPAAHAPTSLVGQLRYVRTNWVAILGDAGAGLLVQIDDALGELAEEADWLHRAFGGPAAGMPVEVPDLAGLDAELERFSPDADWMPGLVLQARSTYVWLDQLSRRYGRDIRTLDAIPDEELDRLAGWGINGLWLIGVWERSRASEQIKHRRGNPAAMASAYAIDDYVVAGELGGEEALVRLRDRALARGVRLACDMVPNHMGVDSRWLVEHPEWFLSVPQPPYPAYGFGGPDLSSDPGVEVVIEDHYWDGSDAAVVFMRRDRGSGETRFVYHGNDGTSIPWNDTAQLDFLRADVREQVIRTILDVARRFPVIRFDAAMVLARKHVRRLWWPEPGAGGGVPSRGAHALPAAEFDQAMPGEFWREVVDRVAAEVPDTLLLAEAFWLLEGYFVRTLGMHRVYNSAFMHMLRDEDVAAYRRLIRDTIEFDPEILERYVNFMSNPDEETAVEQFGRGDKYFGVATVMATLPGLPMLGHGQVEGLAEKYGMEFRRAGWDESPDAAMVARHERELAPLLRQRWRFARATDFRLYDLVHDGGDVDERVLAYSNGRGPTRSVVAYLGQFAEVTGWLRESAAYAVKGPDGSRTLVRQQIADALGLAADPGALVAYRDRRTGLEHLRSVGEIRERGLRVQLGAYACLVLDGFREIPPGAGRWAELAGRLAEAGVPSLDDALADLELEPLHDHLRALFANGHVGRLADALRPNDPGGRDGAPLESSADSARPAPSGAAVEADVEAVTGSTARASAAAAIDAVADWAGQLALAGTGVGSGPEPARSASDAESLVRDRLQGALSLPGSSPDLDALLGTPRTRVELALAIALGAGATGQAGTDGTRDRFDRARLRGPIVDGLRGLGMDDAAAQLAAARLRAVAGLLHAWAQPTSGGTPGPADARARSDDAGSRPVAAGSGPGDADSGPDKASLAVRVAASWLVDPAVRAAAEVNHWEGTDWLVREAWDSFVDLATLVAVAGTQTAARPALANLGEALKLAAAEHEYRADRLIGAASG